MYIVTGAPYKCYWFANVLSSYYGVFTTLKSYGCGCYKVQLLLQWLLEIESNVLLRIQLDAMNMMKCYCCCNSGYCNSRPSCNLSHLTHVTYVTVTYSWYLYY